MANITLDTKGNDELIKKLSETPKNVEDSLNKYLHADGSKEVAKSIIGFIPMSKRKKKHARDSNPFERKDINLGFEVVTFKPYGYLIFPDEGRGRSNPIAHEFTVKGLNSKKDKIFKDILEIIEKETAL